MPHPGKKHYNKQIARSGKLEKNNFIPDDSLMRKGTAMRSQINLYWKKRAEEKKRRFGKAT
tara:strand:+ start:23 stop:205 length:183 start_codon:yes stop_codon:yes gene_type:complete